MSTLDYPLMSNKNNSGEGGRRKAIIRKGNNFPRQLLSTSFYSSKKYDKEVSSFFDVSEDGFLCDWDLSPLSQLTSES